MDAMRMQNDYENQILDLKKERDVERDKNKKVENEYATLRVSMKTREADLDKAKKRKSHLEEKVRDLEARLASSEASSPHGSMASVASDTTPKPQGQPISQGKSGQISNCPLNTHTSVIQDFFFTNFAASRTTEFPKP